MHEDRREGAARAMELEPEGPGAGWWSGRACRGGDLRERVRLEEQKGVQGRQQGRGRAQHVQRPGPHWPHGRN